MVFLIFAVLAAISIIVTWKVCKKIDKRYWNNGQCRKCGGIWYAFDTDSSGARGYKCNSGHHTWISWLKERPIDLEKNKVIGRGLLER